VRGYEIIMNWPKSTSKSNRMGLHLMRSLFYKRIIKFVPLSEKERLHAKVYIFTMDNEKKIIAITSANLTYDSWHRSVEIGFLTEDKDSVNKIDPWVNGLRRNGDVDIIKQDINDRPPTPPVIKDIEKDIIETIEPRYIEGEKYKPVFNDLYEEFQKKYGISEEEIELSVPETLVEVESYDEEIDEPIIELLPENKVVPEQITEGITPNHKVSNMIYVYAAMILFYTGKEISKENINRILDAAGVQPDDVMTSALLSCLRDFDWEKFKEKQ
jgi:hypothetical protein